MLAAPFTVALAPCTSYSQAQVEAATRQVLMQGGLIAGKKTFFSRGMHVLIKPNLLRANELSCTHTAVIRAACLCLQEEGVKVRVADSPGFGTARSVAQSLGIQEALRPLGLQVEDFQSGKKVSLRIGGADFGQWHIAKEALEADAILSLPRVKAHGLMRMTLAVKNMFGCICGLRKAMAHAVQGRTLESFCHSILALYNALPPTAALGDGIIAMDRTGPSGGDAYPLHLLAAAPSAMALDTALYGYLNLNVNDIPLWQEAQSLAFPDAFAHNIHLLGAQATQNIHTTNTASAGKSFRVPQELGHVCFQPHRLVQTYAKRLWTRAF